MDIKALQKIQYGIYIVCAQSDGKRSGQIANCIFQVTSEPILFAVILSKQNFTYELLEKSGKLSISAVTQEAPLKFIAKFGFQSGRNIDKFADAQHIVLQNGTPAVTSYATAIYGLEVINKIDLSTHIEFISKVTDMKVIDETKDTMTYDYYHKIKGGLTAKNAPTYISKTQTSSVL
ncbi:MAG: flavin reductase family protein [Endomicrobium sp.]|jgi:flavin reductase (DIM6/NTAB) family NADH-FMN oxidoreductase RutF|nr:flavin reductase family protein [Endomicrobium sp.]